MDATCIHPTVVPFIVMASCTHGDIMKSERKVPIQLRLPPELKQFIEADAEKNASSQNSEVVRCVRERMERLEKEKGEAPA